MTYNSSRFELFNNCKFFILLFERYSQLLSEHIKTVGNELDIDLDNFDIDNDFRLKKLVIGSLELHSYFEDLYDIPKFFQIDRSLIRKVYTDKMSQATYFAYNYDNFVIRIVTSIDLCGKIGNLLYNLKIQDKYCNWHTFAFHKQIVNTSVSKNLIEISDFLEDFKKERHKKIHWGKSSSNDFEFIITFGGINEVATGDKLDEKEIMDKLLHKEINKIQGTIDRVAILTSAFLDSMIYKLDEVTQSQSGAGLLS